MEKLNSFKINLILLPVIFTFIFCLPFIFPDKSLSDNINTFETKSNLIYIFTSPDLDPSYTRKLISILPETITNKIEITEKINNYTVSLADTGYVYSFNHMNKLEHEIVLKVYNINYKTYNELIDFDEKILTNFNLYNLKCISYIESCYEKN